MMYIDIIDDNNIRIDDDDEKLIIGMSVYENNGEFEAMAYMGGESVDNSAIEAPVVGFSEDDIYEWVRKAESFVGNTEVGGLCVALQNTALGEPMNKFFTLLEGSEWDTYPTGPAIIWGNVVESKATPGIFTADEIYDVSLWQGHSEKEDFYSLYYEADVDYYLVDPRN